MQIIKVQYIKNSAPAGRAYTFYSEVDVVVGDTVQINESAKGVVAEVGVDESEIESFKDKVKTIVGKVIERKIYSSYAFSEDEREKGKINREIYEELKSKWRISSSKDFYNQESQKREPINMDDFDLVYERKACHAHGEYTICKNTTDLSSDEIALICDGGNLCFGYTRDGENFYYVFED